MNDQSLDRRPRLCLISFSPIADDARVRRHADTLVAAGWDVVAVGLPGAKSTPPAWKIIDTLPALAAPTTPEAPQESAEGAGDGASDGAVAVVPAASELQGRPPRSFVRRLLAFCYWRTLGLAQRLQQASGMPIRSIIQRIVNLPGTISRRLVTPLVRHFVPQQMKEMTLSQMRTYLPLLKAHVSRKAALDIYWSWGNMQEMYQKAQGVEADLWIANDWSTLPIVARLIEEKGGVYLYDSHEFATEEYPNDPWWRLFTQPVAKAVERTYIAGARYSFSVSPGIAKALNALYRLSPPNEVLRNMPGRIDLSFRPTGERIEVLYHGILSSSRGLEAAIRSVPQWRPEFHLTIRGPGSPAYLASLRKLIRQTGVNDRVTLAEPLPMIELVRAATAFDIGFFALLDDSPQNKYVLPNKFFEYVNAGLALCVSDCPDMAELLNRHDLGVLMKSTSPDDIARAINSLDRAGIDRFKRHSIAAAETLCWEAEQEKLLRACNQAIGRTVVAA